MTKAVVDAVVRDHGEWTAMAIKLGNGTYTREPAVDHRLLRLLQVASDTVGKSLSQCRVLDLACLEGHYALEFAKHGAEVIGIEGRQDSVEKCNFAKEALGLDRAKFVQGDVRNLSVQEYGQFDIVICSGLLYHLPAGDAWTLLKSIYAACKGVMLLDTFISLSGRTELDLDGMHVHGHVYGEHDPNASAEEKAKLMWASLDNNTSFWFTEPSLVNLIARVGFSSVVDVLTPVMPGNLRDRKTYVAIKGTRVEVLTSDPTNVVRHTDIPEGQNHRMHASQTPPGPIFSAGRRLLPPAVKEAVKPTLRALGILPPDTTPEFMKKAEKNSRKP